MAIFNSYVKLPEGMVLHPIKGRVFCTSRVIHLGPRWAPRRPRPTCSLQTGIWALIVFTVLVWGQDLCRLGWEVPWGECPRILGFWVHDKPRNSGELQLGLPHHFSLLFFHVFFRLWQDHCNQCTEESYKGAPLFFRHSFISFGHGSLLHILKWPACSWVLELLCCWARYCSPFTDVI